MRLTDQQQRDIAILFSKGKSQREIAKEVLGRESRKSTVGDFLREQGLGKVEQVKAIPEVYNKGDKLPKILTIDIENSPILADVWSLWNNNVGLNQVVKDWFIMSFSAKWYGSDEVIYDDNRDTFLQEDDHRLCAKIWELLDEADFVIGQNSIRFDEKKIRARLILNGFPPPSPFRSIDTLEISKRVFGFTSNKLEYLTDKLCTRTKKSVHKKFPGHYLWRECLRGNQEAWEEMASYNPDDVLSTEELFEVLAPWDNKLPNMNLYYDDLDDMSDWVECGFHHTNLGRYQRYRNVKTGQYRRGRTNLLSKEKRKQLLANIL